MVAHPKSVMRARGLLTLALSTLFLLGAAFPNPAIDSRSGAAQAKVVLAGGCFWGMEAVFEALNGVTNAVSGYAGGSQMTAHYEMVSTGTTGHAESVELTYDPKKITFGQLLKVYFSVAHDPTELNRQGPDEGTQYRSEIFYTNDSQRRIAEAYIKQLTQAKVFSKPIVTKLQPLQGFYAAEAYHQHFVENNPKYPYVVYNDLPKLEALKTSFPNLLKRRS